MRSRIGVVLTFSAVVAMIGAFSCLTLAHAEEGGATDGDSKLTVFGVKLGQPLTLPPCEYLDKNVYLRVKATCANRLDTGQALIQFPASKLPMWAQTGSYPGFTAILRDAILVKIEVPMVVQDRALYDALVEKYGKPTSTRPKTFSNGYGNTSKGEDWEWQSGKVHVQYTLDRSQDDLSRRMGRLIVEVASELKERKAKAEQDKASRLKL